MLFFQQIQPVTREQARASLLERLDGVGFTASSWPERSIPRAFVEVGAHIWSKMSDVAVALKRAQFNATADEDALDAYSWSHYRNRRQLAVKAQRLITLSCLPSEGPYAIDVGDLVVSSPDGHTFRNIEGHGVTYPATLRRGQTLELLFEAEAPGEAHNFDDGSLTADGVLVTTLAGTTIAADVKHRLGVDRESDERLRRRNETKWALLTGLELTDRAVENIILTAVPGIGVVKVNSTNPRGPGTFDIYVASGVGVPTRTAEDGDVELAQKTIERYILDQDPSEVVHVIAAPAVPLNLSGNVFHDREFSAEAVRSAVEAALVEFIRTIPLSGFDYSPGPANVVPKNDIEAVIKGVTIDGKPVVKTVQLATPASDIIVPSWGKVVPPNTTRTWPSLVYQAVVGNG
jgi:hypothetical protein